VNSAAEQPVRVLEQGAFEEHERTVRLEGLEDRHVLPLEPEARLAPFHVLVQPALEQDRPDLLHFASPRLGAAHERIDLGISRRHCGRVD
jgi:hypothetical protein